MPHQCVRCSKIYPTGCKELLTGCNCGGKFFFFVKEEQLKKVEELMQSLSFEEKTQMEKDIFEIIDQTNSEEPVILDFESIRVTAPGKYEIDLIDLFKGNPLVFRLEEGKYLIDIPSTFSNEKKPKSK